MARLAPQFSSNRMLFEYVQDVYQPAARMFRERAASGGALAVTLTEWGRLVRHRWREIHIADFDARRNGDFWTFRVHVSSAIFLPMRCRRSSATACRRQAACCDAALRGDRRRGQQVRLRAAS
jgi:hypothetical protein